MMHNGSAWQLHMQFWPRLSWASALQQVTRQCSPLEAQTQGLYGRWSSQYPPQTYELPHVYLPCLCMYCQWKQQPASAMTVQGTAPFDGCSTLTSVNDWQLVYVDTCQQKKRGKFATNLRQAGAWICSVLYMSYWLAPAASHHGEFQSSSCILHLTCEQACRWLGSGTFASCKHANASSETGMHALACTCRYACHHLYACHHMHAMMVFNVQFNVH